MPNGRCYLHGGATPSGIASPQFKDGRYSKVLPPRLKERYEAALKDPQLLEQRPEISLLDARLADLLARVDTGESGAIWQGLMAQRMELIAAQRAADVKGQAAAMRAIIDLIAQGHADYQAWADVHAVIEQRKRITESERKRLVEAQQMITTEQAWLLIQGVIESLTTHITDRKILTAIQNDITRLTTYRPILGAEPV